MPPRAARLLAAALAALLVCAAATRSLHVGLHASWSNTRSAAEALSWLVQTLGNDAARPFLADLTRSLAAHPPDTPVSEALQHRLIVSAVARRYPTALLPSTLAWVLHSRHYSPRVFLHYSIADETLAAFGHRPRPHVFAVAAATATARARAAATLLLDPRHVSECPDCPTVTSSSSDALPFLQPLTDDIVLNPACAAPAQQLIVYADVVAPHFAPWLAAIDRAAETCSHRVVLRFCQAHPQPHSPSLQGFTVAATLKSTEYKVVDDRVFETRLFTDCAYGHVQCNQPPNATVEYAWPGGDQKNTFTGLQALQYIVHKADGSFDSALHNLRLFAEDGPSVTRAKEFVDADYVDKHVEAKWAKAVRHFREALGEHDYVYINGRSFDIYSLTQSTDKLFQCLSAISASSTHLHVMANEQRLGSPPGPIMPPHRIRTSTLRVKLDFDHLLPKSLVRFNDIMKDSRYKKWDTMQLGDERQVNAFVNKVNKLASKPIKHGTDHLRLVKVKSHHLSLVLVVDPGDEQQFAFLSVPESVIRADLPIRVAVVLVPNGQVSALIAAGFHYFLRLKGRKTAVQFISMIRQVLQYVGGGFQQVALSPQFVEMAFNQVALESPGEYFSAAAVLEHDAEIKEKLREAERFAEDMNLFKTAKAEEHQEDGQDAKKLSLLCLFNGIVVKDVAADAIPLAVAEQERIANLLMSPNAPQPVKSASSFDQWVAQDPDLIVVNRLGRDMKTEDRRSTFKDQGDGLPPMKANVLFNLRDEVNAVKYAGDNHSSDALRDDHTVTVWLAALDRRADAFKNAADILSELASSSFASRTRSRYAVMPENSRLNAEVLGCSGSITCVQEPVFAINGKRIPASSVQVADDLLAEIASEFERQAIPDTLKGEMRLVHHLHAQEVSEACSEASDPTQGGGSVPFSEFSELLTSRNMTDLQYSTSAPDRDADEQTALSVVATVDPMSSNAYVITALIDALRDSFPPQCLTVRLVLAPSVASLKKHLDQPTTYTKFLLQAKASFHADSNGRVAPTLQFHRLPQGNVLTVALEPPRAWFVSSFATNYDMDNVILESLPEGATELHAEYELKNLIVEGSCVDETESPPQGLKLILENDSGIFVDTLVMANLGYFQLKVPTPGRWKLRLAPGPSSKIFSLRTMEMYKNGIRTVYTADSVGRVPIPVESLSGAGGILLRVARNPGMDGMSVLDPEGDTKQAKDGGNVVGRIRSTFRKMYRGSQAKSEVANASRPVRPEKIHVFSVASGHLYERFLKIMISSVTKHASRPVKFWLLENYLSPSFKKVLPHFAKEHGAEVGMVTYRWPGWLRAQTEKQRIIWAYKILFLDVLFPLDVGRIIFVDSDQVIRGDLAELMDIDLHGAPYGYVPFCDSRKEVEGYRFWKTGFWKDTLRGAKYRISALYVVDLNRFRETAAGDTLRYIYQSLSADPNSLSNLDQDLPNYASTASALGKSVPIYDLPADWLWCESWCDDESKKTAKAIDLCNNPMTKEPKLASAKRIISEWVDYDDAATKLTEKLYKTLLQDDEFHGEDVTNETVSPGARDDGQSGSQQTKDQKDEL